MGYLDVLCTVASNHCNANNTCAKRKTMEFPNGVVIYSIKVESQAGW